MGEIWRKIKSGSKGIADKTGEAIETGRLKREISDHRKKIEPLLRQLGHLAWERYTSGDRELPLSDGKAIDLLREVQLRNQTIDTLEKKIEEAADD